MDKKLRDLKKQYQNISIPKELDDVVEQALQRKKKKQWKPQWFFTLAAASVLLFTISINTNSVFAKNMANIPIINSIVEVLTFSKIEDHQGNHEASIEIPKITGDSEEIAALNAQYAAEGREIYEQYLEFSAEMDKDGHFGVESGYQVLTDNEQILSFARYVVEMVGSSSTIMRYTTIDKAQQIAITLQGLFRDERYVETISSYIVEQMKLEMEQSKGEKVYWVATGKEDDALFENFEKIQKEQNFYITNDGKLVISFDKYEVAPGYMGIVDFEIPTELIQPLLVSNTYIK
ncbi:RsiV family protein [Solibacillus sp. MA9]|uniref:RsiV family protein n=1 Tax=Solibacillus palustris TaxID=2908203 RepID=A0ABS9UE07_9BACL|nr:RsiV family protein [Solibacillus sp. MA9]MCH7322563.1 RsiV family protein [Solibacillus sp. MA9]